MKFSKGDNGDIIGVVENLSEPECDMARSLTHVPLSNGAFSSGTSYRRGEGDFSIRVRASSRGSAQKACEEWMDAIHERLDE